jgi:hypothetical protein
MAIGTRAVDRDDRLPERIEPMQFWAVRPWAADLLRGLIAAAVFQLKSGRTSAPRWPQAAQMKHRFGHDARGLLRSMMSHCFV